MARSSQDSQGKEGRHPGQQLGAVDPCPSRPLDPRVSYVARSSREPVTPFLIFIETAMKSIIKINEVNNNHSLDLGGIAGFLGLDGVSSS